MLSMIIDGVERYFGNIVPVAGLAYDWPVYGDAPQAPMIARSQWPALIAQQAPGLGDPYLGYVHDQNGIGQCNASATCSAIERRRLAEGLADIHLSAGDLYGRINGGVDRGSMLEDGLRVAMADGIAPVREVPYLDWRSSDRQDRPSRKRFRVLEAWLCPTFDHCASAVLSGFDLISGIMWHENYRPDADGWLPVRGSGSAGGHAVHGFKLVMRAGAGTGFGFGIVHKNSWSSTWGQNGLCVFPEPAYSGPVGGWWAVRVTVTEEGDVPAPKEVA